MPAEPQLHNNFNGQLVSRFADQWSTADKDTTLSLLTTSIKPTNTTLTYWKAYFDNLAFQDQSTLFFNSYVLHLLRN